MFIVTSWRQISFTFYVLVHEILRKFNIEGYKFVHILWPRYHVKCKKSFSTMLLIYASECIGYYWIKWTTTVTMQLSGRSLLIASV